jgi:acetyl-CoA acetyltransferase
MTQPAGRVYVTAGHHIAGSRIETESLEEMIFEAVSTAIEKAGLTPQTVDAIVISGNDQTDGRIISCMVTAGPAGGVGKNVTTIASAPEHAFAYGYLRLLAGQGTNTVVVGWSKPSESVYPEHAELVSADPFMVRPIGMNRLIAAALQASVHAPTESTSSGSSASDRMIAWPLTQADCQSHADGVCAIVLQTSDAAPSGIGGSSAWVRGVGWAMDRYDIGDREDREAGGLDAATDLALKQAGKDFGPIDTLDVFTVGAPNERRLIERVTERLGSTDTVSHPSTGQVNPDFAAGLFTIWRAAQRVMSPNQPGGPARAAAVSTLGFAAQGSTVVLLSDLSEV